MSVQWNLSTTAILETEESGRCRGGGGGWGEGGCYGEVEVQHLFFFFQGVQHLFSRKKLILA